MTERDVERLLDKIAPPECWHGAANLFIEGCKLGERGSWALAGDVAVHMLRNGNIGRYVPLGEIRVNCDKIIANFAIYAPEYMYAFADRIDEYLNRWNMDR